MLTRKDLAKKFEVSEVTIKNWFETTDGLKELQITKRKGKKMVYEYPDNAISEIKRIIYKETNSETEGGKI